MRLSITKSYLTQLSWFLMELHVEVLNFGNSVVLIRNSSMITWALLHDITMSSTPDRLSSAASVCWKHLHICGISPAKHFKISSGKLIPVWIQAPGPSTSQALHAIWASGPGEYWASLLFLAIFSRLEYSTLYTHLSATILYSWIKRR